MQSINEDPEYRTLKEQVKSKELKAQIYGFVSTAAFVGAYALFTMGTAGMLGFLTPAIAPVAAAAAAAIGLFSGYSSFRIMQDVRLDTEELNARRSAVHLSRSFGVDRAPQEVAVAHAMGRRDGKSWTEALDAMQHETAASPTRH